MRVKSSIAGRCVCCALSFPLCLTLHASTIGTVTASVSYEAFPGDFYVPCSQTDPSSASCVLSYPQVDSRSSATAADGDIAVNVLGATSGLATEDAEANALASFTQLFTFTPYNGQDAPTAVQYDLWYVSNAGGDEAGSTATFNGVRLNSSGGPNLQTITQPYSGGTFQSAGQVTAGASGQGLYGDGVGFANAELHVLSITMLDAQGNAVAGALVDPPDAIPEPVSSPLTGLLGLALVILFAKRRATFSSRIL